MAYNHFLMKTYLSLLSSIYIVKGTFIGATVYIILCEKQKCVNNFSLFERY